MKYVSGLIFQEHPGEDSWEFSEGYLGFQGGVIQELEWGELPSGHEKSNELLGSGIIIPTLANLHTHIGDSIAKDIEFQSPPTIESIFAPPDGLKHRILRDANESDLIHAMRSSLLDMQYSGIVEFCDFREEGMKGINQLNQAIKGLPLKPFIMGRPRKLQYIKEELDELLLNVDGIGLSSISDWDLGELEAIADHTKSSGKLFALHASERVREDLDLILDLKPDFLVHMTKGTPDDLETLASENVPVILCPRSNGFFGNTPNIKAMLEKNITLALGTDNVMLNPPDIFQELEFAYKILSSQVSNTDDQTTNNDGNASKLVLDPVSEVFKMGMMNFRKVLNHKYNIQQQRLQVGQEAKFILIEVPYELLDPTRFIIKDVTIKNISIISIGNEFLWCGNEQEIEDKEVNE